MITAAPSLTSNIANTSTGKLTDTPLGPPRGTAPVTPPRNVFTSPIPVNAQSFVPRPVAQTFPIVTPRGTFVPTLPPPRPSTPTVNPVFVNTDIVSIPRPKTNDDGLTVNVVPQIVGSLPPRGIINTANIPIQTIQLLNPTAAVLATTPIPTNIPKPFAGPRTFNTTVTDEDGKPIENANIYLAGTAIGATNKDGQGKGFPMFNPLEVIKISIVGYEPFESLVSQLPSKVVLKKGIQLDPVVIKNRIGKGFPWLYAILIGGGLYLGYKTMNKSGSIKASI